jgi:hypothetical protein
MSELFSVNWGTRTRRPSDDDWPHFKKRSIAGSFAFSVQRQTRKTQNSYANEHLGSPLAKTERLIVCCRPKSSKVIDNRRLPLFYLHRKCERADLSAVKPTPSPKFSDLSTARHQLLRKTHFSAARHRHHLIDANASEDLHTLDPWFQLRGISFAKDWTLSK